jgi:hypothetical protein
MSIVNETFHEAELSPPEAGRSGGELREEYGFCPYPTRVPCVEARLLVPAWSRRSDIRPLWRRS